MKTPLDAPRDAALDTVRQAPQAVRVRGRREQHRLAGARRQQGKHEKDHKHPV